MFVCLVAITILAGGNGHFGQPSVTMWGKTTQGPSSETIERSNDGIVTVTVLRLRCATVIFAIAWRTWQR